MPVNKNVEQQQTETPSTGKRELTATSFRKSGRKAPGTRLGMLNDWREGSTEAISSRYAHTIRDGR
jgi:hypothetical protein